MIRHCSCTGYRGNDQAACYQTERYGVGRRVVTTFTRDGATWGRCTVCGDEQKVRDAAKPQKEKSA